MYFSLLLAQPFNLLIRRIILVGFANEVICLTTTLQTLLNQSEPQFLAQIKTVYEKGSTERQTFQFLPVKNQSFLMNFCSHLAFFFLNAKFFTWDLLLNHKPLMLRYCQSEVCKGCVTQM